MSDPDPVELLRDAAVLTDHPVDVGLRTEAAILGRLVKVGYRVLVPFGVNQRYDLVIDVDGQFVRAQCKTGRMRNGVIIFNTRSVRTNTRCTIFREYQGEADVFLVYCGATDGIYLVSVRPKMPSQMYLRVDPTRNGQLDGIHWAQDYELPA